MQTFATVVHVLTCVLLVLVVLLQSGKGAEISASFGGSSQTVFGTAGGANFFTRFTSALAGIFMVTSVVLSLMGAQASKSVMSGVTPAAPPAEQKPAAVPPASETRRETQSPPAPSKTK